MAAIVSRLYAGSDRTRQDTSSTEFATNPTEPGLNSDSSISASDYDISRIDGPVPERVVDELHAVLQPELTDRYSFERTTENLKYCLTYLKSTVFVAREADTGTLLGFVIIGTLTKGGLSECRVLEAAWRQPVVTR